MYLFLEMIGTVAFAVSGAMVGIKHKLDLLGVCVLGMTTAVGGGIIRDIIINVAPPVAFQEPKYALVSLVVSLILFIPTIRNKVDTDGFFINFTDAIGLGIFTVTGVKAGLAYDSVFLQIFLGTITGVGGGVLRDIFVTEKPMIFVRHFYAVTSILGAMLCSLIFPHSEKAAAILSTAVVVVLRVLAAKYKWHLPKA